jgi:spore germination protein GerM
MVEPTGHCPYLGLKQNRAIRFSSPTPEHRCYVGGEPIEIPVDQASYCLSRGHVSCPLYMGLTVPTTPVAAGTGLAGVQPVPAGGLRGWFTALPPRDRAVYALMIGMLFLIVLIYLAAGLQSFGRPTSSGPTATVVKATPGGAATGASPEPPTPTDEPATQTAVPATPTLLPSSTPEPAPTARPTDAPTILQPTATAAVSTAAPTTAAPATSVPATSVPATSAATRVPATQAPTAPPASVTSEVLWLYFADESGSLYVPVQRTVQVTNKAVAEAAVRELISGPQEPLSRLVLPNVRLLDLRIERGTAFVNLDRLPSSPGDDRGLFSIVLSLTHFPAIEQVQILVNGQPTSLNGGAPVPRPVLNPLNPDRLPFDYRTTEFLPTYYPTADGSHDVRIIRMVPKTRETAAGTMRALLDGPGEYGPFVREVIPDGTQLLGVRINDGVVTVNLSGVFAEAGDRSAATRTIVESLTSLPTVRGVRFEVEGRSLGERWGDTYGGTFARPLINPE